MDDFYVFLEFAGDWGRFMGQHVCIIIHIKYVEKLVMLRRVVRLGGEKSVRERFSSNKVSNRLFD